MVSKNTLKMIKSLASKKGRDTHGLFVVEGYKSVCELLESDLIIQYVLVMEGCNDLPTDNCERISVKEMQTISSLKTPPGYLAVFKKPVSHKLPLTGKIVVLDGIQDPGNLGTIIRLCDWFDIRNIVCSNHTVDLYNPKTVQASMASIARVAVQYTDLISYINAVQLPIYVTTMDGASVYEKPLPDNALLILGNESHGLRPEIIEKGIPCAIPQYGKATTESLNVATATAILLAEWLRPTGM